MKNKLYFIDLHGIHLLDYEPYYLSQKDVKKSLLLSCSIPEVFSQITEFRNKYEGYIGVLPYTYSGFDNIFSFENEQMCRLYSFLTFTDARDSVIPFFAISANPKNRKNLEGILERQKIKEPFGFKFHSLAAQKPISSLFGSETLSFLDQIKGILILHSGKDDFSNPNQTYFLAKKYRSINFIVAHFGSLDKEFLSKLNDYENIYIDTSILSDIVNRLGGNDRHFEETILETILRFNLENKLIFGSDYPWTKLAGSSPEKERSLLLNSNLPLHIKENWAFKTIKNILKKK